MTLGAVVLWIVVGLIAGWVAGQVLQGGGFGVIGDMIVGIIGALIGGLAFAAAVPNDSLVLGAIVALTGAVLLLLIERLIRRA